MRLVARLSLTLLAIERLTRPVLGRRPVCHSLFGDPDRPTSNVGRTIPDPQLVVSAVVKSPYM